MGCISPGHLMYRVLNNTSGGEGEHNRSTFHLHFPFYSYCRLQPSMSLSIPHDNSNLAIVPSTAARQLPSSKYISSDPPSSLCLSSAHTHFPTYIPSQHHAKWHSSSSSPSSLFWGGSLASMTFSPSSLRSLRLVRIPRLPPLPLPLLLLPRLVRRQRHLFRVESVGLLLGLDLGLLLRFLRGRVLAPSFLLLGTALPRASTTLSWTSGPPRPLAKWKEVGIRCVDGGGLRSVVKDWQRG
jgi:hypothetical protein